MHGADPQRATWVADGWQDAGYALRQFRRAPGFAVVVILTLGIGIGATAATGNAIDRLLLRAPEHVMEPDRVVRLLLETRGPQGEEIVSARTNFPTFEDFAREVDGFANVAAYSSASLSVGEGVGATQARATLVTGSYFTVLGVRPVLGRMFRAADDEPGTRGAYAVLSYHLWLRQFGADTAILGRDIRIGSLRYTAIGIAPPDFRGVEPFAPDVWLPLVVAAERDLGIPISLEDRGSAWLSVIARLGAGTSPQIAEQQATTVWREHNLAAGASVTPRRILAASIALGRGPDRPRETSIVLWLAAVSSLVLLIACANVANLLLARAHARQGEISVRMALGASRRRLARQLLTEAFLLSLVGGMVGTALAVAGGQVIRTYLLPDAPAGPAFDHRLMVAIIGCIVVTAAIISLSTVVRITAPALGRFLRENSSAISKRSTRARMALLGLQGALSMVLVVVAGLFTLSFRRVQQIDLGMDVDGTLMAWVDLESARLPSSEIRAVYDAMLQRVRRVDGVSAAALAARNPFTAGRVIPTHTPERSEEALWHHEGIAQVPREILVDSGFFHAIGATSLQGRDFEHGDRRGAQRVAIVNRNLARVLWSGENPLGQCMLVTFEGNDCVRIVGVVDGFLRRTILDRDELIAYLPLSQSESGALPGSMLIAASGSPRTVAALVRETLSAVRPDLPAVNVMPMRDVLRPQFRPWEAAATLFVIFAVVAFVIAAVGLYGVVSFAAAQRAQDIAIRAALGAGPRHIIAVVAGSGLYVVAAGLMVGGIVGLVIRHWLGPLLFQTSSRDPFIIAGVAAGLFGVAMCAGIIPPIRLLRRGSIAALRGE